MRMVCLYHWSAESSAGHDSMPGLEANRDLYPEDICCVFFFQSQSYRPFPLSSPPAPTDVRKLFWESKPAVASHCSSTSARKDPSHAVSQAATPSLHQPWPTPGPWVQNHGCCRSLLVRTVFGSAVEGAEPGSLWKLSQLPQAPHQRGKSRSECPQQCWRAAPSQTWGDCGNST